MRRQAKAFRRHYVVDHTEALRERERGGGGVQIYEMELKPKLSQHLVFCFFSYFFTKSLLGIKTK